MCKRLVSERAGEQTFEKCCNTFLLQQTLHGEMWSDYDFQRLHGELHMTDDQLRDVFDSLDVDGNGFLTFNEFCDGLGKKYKKLTHYLKK